MAVGMYSRSFFIPPAYLGLWFVQGGFARVCCFDPETLPQFPLSHLNAETRDDLESGRRPYYATAHSDYQSIDPACRLAIDPSLPAGVHKAEVPPRFRAVQELLLVVESIIVSLRPRSGDFTILPQEWLTGDQFDPGYQWITRVARHPKTGRLVGDGIRIAAFELTEDGCHLARWL